MHLKTVTNKNKNFKFNLFINENNPKGIENRFYKHVVTIL